MKKMELGQALRAALLAALTAVLAQVQLPIGPVPFNLAVLGAFLAGMLLRPAWAACAMGVYMALGLIGIPVFAGFVGGPAVLAGKTGGYVLGYVCIAWCTAMARRFGRLWLTAAGMALGLVLCYALGTAWFMGMTGTGLGPSLAFCVWPFIVPDICKGACALAVGTAVAKRLSEPIEKFPMNLQEYGNTSSASIPILLDELNRAGKLEKGRKIVMAGFGAGLSWGASILEWK